MTKDRYHGRRFELERVVAISFIDLLEKDRFECAEFYDVHLENEY